jgi:hypothetical protein
MKAALLFLALLLPLHAQEPTEADKQPVPAKQTATITKRTAAKGDGYITVWTYRDIDLILVSAETNRRVYIHCPARGEYRVEGLKPGKYMVYSGEPDAKNERQLKALADTEKSGRVEYDFAINSTPGQRSISLRWEGQSLN